MGWDATGWYGIGMGMGMGRVAMGYYAWVRVLTM